MNYIEFTKILKSANKKEMEIKSITKEDIKGLQHFIHFMHIEDIFNSCDSASAFYKKYPTLSRMYPRTKFDNVFYGLKLGKVNNSIPLKATYFIRLAITEYGKEYPNRTIWHVQKYIEGFADRSFGEYTLQDIIDSEFGKAVQVLTSGKRISGNEVYIESEDMIAVLPDDIIKNLSNDDCKRIEYDKQNGLHIDKSLIRTMGDRIGITTDDFNLKDCL